MIAYRPRFVAVSVTGWPISHSRNIAGKKTPAVFWYVLDRAVCHRIVAAYDWGQDHKQDRAERRAAELNAAEEAWLAERGLT